MENIVYILFFSLVGTFLLTLFVLTFLIKHLIKKILQIELVKKAETFEKAVKLIEKDNKHNKKVEEILNKEEIKDIEIEIEKKHEQISEDEVWLNGAGENYNFSNNK